MAGRRLLDPGDAEQLAAGANLITVAGLAITGVHLGVPVAAIIRNPDAAGGVQFAREWPHPDDYALVVLASVEAARRYLWALTQASPVNLQTVMDANQAGLDAARRQAQTPWAILQWEAERIVEQHWDRIVGLAQQLADNAGVHGPIPADPRP